MLHLWQAKYPSCFHDKHRISPVTRKYTAVTRIRYGAESHVLVSLPYHQFTLDISVRRFGLAAFRPLETCCGLDVDNHTNWRSICLRCSGSLLGNHLHRPPAFRYLLSSSFIKTSVNGTAFMLVYMSRNSGLWSTRNIDYRWQIGRASCRERV